MNRRWGTTLVEVLMALFIMGIGLMALLTLFPMGALQMAQALKDQRAAEEAASAIGSLRVSWKRSYEASTTAVKFDPGTTGIGAAAPQPIQETGTESYVYALDDVYAMQRDATTTAPFGTRPPGAPSYNNGNPPYNPNIPMASIRSIGPSYTVFIDPVGYRANANVGKFFLGGSSSLFIPRRSFNAIETATTSVDQSTLALRYCFLTDDMAFQPDTGQPDPNAPRGGQYSVAWMIRRQTNVVRDQLNNVYVIVYRGRSMDVASEELVLPAAANTDVLFFFNTDNQPTNTVSVAYSGTRPPIRKGTWILDALDTTNGGAIPTDVFYRVVAVEDGTRVIAGNPVPTLELELQTNHRRTIPKVGTPNSTGLVASSGTILVLDKVVEVFEKRPVDSTSSPDFR